MTLLKTVGTQETLFSYPERLMIISAPTRIARILNQLSPQ